MQSYVGKKSDFVNLFVIVVLTCKLFTVELTTFFYLWMLQVAQHYRSPVCVVIVDNWHLFHMRNRFY